MNYSSIFGDLTKTVQVRIDKASELKKQLFDQNVFEKYMIWDTPKRGLSFSEIIGSYGISVAATTMGANGNIPILGTEGLETLAQKVLLHGVGYQLTVDEYREVLDLLDSKSINDMAKAQILIDTMFNNIKKAVNGVNAKIDLIFLNALSNKGILTLDGSNNPEGGSRLSIDYKLPSENIATVTTTWSEANVGTVDCWAGIQAIVDAAESKVVLDKMLMSRAKLSYILRSTKMKQVIFGTDKQSTPLLMGDLNNFLSANGMPQVEVIRRTVRINNNGVMTDLTPWNDDNIVFVPQGNLGVIKNAFADSEIMPEDGVAYSNSGRIRISQFKIGEKEGASTAETTKAQVFALPVFTEVNGIYSLTTIK